MGHLGNGKDLFKKLGQKIDGMTARVPFNDKFYNILKELYTPEEAEVVVKMPYGMSNFERIARIVNLDRPSLLRILESLCSKGLVMDLWLNEEYQYALSPFMIGIFEMTMMRVGEEANPKKWARLFEEYLVKDKSVYAANYQHGERFSFIRTLPHEEIVETEYLEILDFEKATAIVNEASRCAIGICSCRHEKFHNATKTCDTPLEMCTSFDYAADILVRHHLAKEVAKEQVLANIEYAKEQGLVLNADAVKRKVTFLCFCCKCCCNALAGINKYGYANAVMTSSYLAAYHQETCTGCGKCVQMCPVEAITMMPSRDPQSPRKKIPEIETSRCLGCGVCGLKCLTGSMKLVQREQRVITPETTFHKILLLALEKGTLQNQLFDNPQDITHKFLRGFFGGFLKLSPVKRALLSETLRSRFLTVMEKGVQQQGKEWLVNL
ncbi:MAG: 4Fe-4S dicluster domain-containing protein [Chlorobiaceae bacterium]